MRKRVLDAREASLLALNLVEEDGAFVNLALSDVLRGTALETRDKKLATELTYGVISRKLTLDWMISQVAGRPVVKLDKLILNLLRIGFYQLFYLDRVPAPAACHTTVELAKRGRKRALAPFVNGVMRGALRSKDSLPWPDREKAEADYLSLVYSHPLWMVKRWLARFGVTETEALLNANNANAPLSIRTNTLRITRQDLLNTLTEEGFVPKPSDVVPEGIITAEGGRLFGLQAYRSGYFQVQGESAMLASHVLSPRPGERVLDGCSAPGGKTTHLAQLMENQGEILALDIHSRRLELVEANCRRLGIKNVRTFCLDAREIDVAAHGMFDRILLDVPCSGLGVIRRKPDLKWRRWEEDLTELAEVQKKMLTTAATALKPGGVLVYSTCTNEPEETDRVIASFLHEHSGFIAENAAPYLPEQWREHAGPAGVHLFPHRHGVDGFFICRLVSL